PPAHALSYSLSLHDALPISIVLLRAQCGRTGRPGQHMDIMTELDHGTCLVPGIGANPAKTGFRWVLKGHEGYLHGRSLFLSRSRSEEHTSELQSLRHLVCRL